MIDDSNLSMMLGEIKGRLDTFIAIAEADRSAWRDANNEMNARVSKLETHMTTTQTTGGFLKWAGYALVGLFSAACSTLAGSHLK